MTQINEESLEVNESIQLFDREQLKQEMSQDVHRVFSKIGDFHPIQQFIKLEAKKDMQKIK